MKTNWLFLSGLLAICLGCSQQATTLTDKKSETDDSAMVDEQAETLDSDVGASANADSSDADKVADDNDARVVLRNAIASAKQADKKVLVHYGSPG